jgi:hypothetical protein
LSIPADATRSLAALKTARDAGRLAWAHRDDLLRLAVVPVLLSFLLALADAAARGALGAAPGAEPQPVPVLLKAVLLTGQVLLNTLFSVNWLRVLLLAEARGRPSLELRWTRRHGLFLGRALLLGFGLSIGMLVVASVTTGIGAIGAAPVAMSPAGAIALALIGLAAGYLFLRLSLVLPAAAVDHAYTFARSWRDTATAGVAMMLAVLAVGVVVMLVTVAYVAIAAGLHAMMPLSMLLLGTAIDYVFTAILLGVLAIAFHHCTGWRDPARVAPPPADGA